MWAGEARVRHMFKWMAVSTDKQVLRCFALPARRCRGFRIIGASFLDLTSAPAGAQRPGVDSVRAAKTHAARFSVSRFERTRQQESMGCILGAHMMCGRVMM
jgi:hypothetical protein